MLIPITPAQRGGRLKWHIGIDLPRATVVLAAAAEEAEKADFKKWVTRSRAPCR
jgi:hypothetical protein